MIEFIIISDNKLNELLGVGFTTKLERFLLWVGIGYLFNLGGGFRGCGYNRLLGYDGNGECGCG
jgi:hypothetical protein